MRVRIVELARAGEARAAAVVIDVLRACATAAAAVAAGADGVVPAATVAQARALGARLGAPVAGEVGGFPVDGFDLTNSPVAAAGWPFDGRPLVLRTTAGTQGLLRCATAADMVFAAGFVNARATVAAVRASGVREVTLVVTGSHSPDGGCEDRALADYLAACWRGEQPAPGPFLERARCSHAARRFLPGGDLAGHRADLEHCLTLDRHEVALCLETSGEPPRLRPC